MCVCVEAQRHTFVCAFVSSLFFLWYAQEQVRVDFVSLSLSLSACVCVLALALMKPISTASLMAAYTVTGRQREIGSIY